MASQPITTTRPPPTKAVQDHRNFSTMAKITKRMEKPAGPPSKKKTVPAKGNKKERPVIKAKRQKASVARAVKNKEAKLVENTKQLLVLRGNKTNESVNQLLRDLKMIKAPDAKVLSKKNELHPFDDPNSIEFLTHKNDTSLFVLGSSTKKRPNNIIFGRTFDGHIMDMLEMGFDNFKSIDEFKCKSKMAPGSKPCFLFAGAEWEQSEPYQKLKNVLVDIFRGTIVTAINLKGLDHVIVCSAANNRVLFRHYSIAFQLTTDTKVKNVSRDELTGDKIGRIHLDKQDIYSMQVRRVKALRKSPGDLKKADASAD
ncbi:hypothetical protein DYB32_000215 [Aphanomyces invadans]|uniref:Ribosome production factor 2 homolog n=1 Tax=Aphanomyces invadans TaxID=157072 RepID=A0A3R6W4X3_9STRA|nr:hypothetical protein DYB32_000215 [Aphanomyces invadans]